MKRIINKNIVKSIFMLFTILLLAQCKDDIQQQEIADSDLVISQYIDNHSDYSEFNKLLLNTGLNFLLSIRGPYSLFLPTNKAMNDYYKLKNINSFTDLDSTAKKELVYNHIIPYSYRISDYPIGSLKEKNALGDNVITEFIETEVYINKYAKVTKRDISVSNGVIQEIDKVLDPLKLSVYDVLASTPEYSIFAQALDAAGLKDTLNLISFEYGQKIARTRFTILAVDNTTFSKYGISSLNDLKAKLFNNADSLYEFMDFHCLDKNAYFLNNMPKSPTLYSVLSKNNQLQIRVQNGVYKINLVGEEYTGINVNLSNVPGKNGVIHNVDNLLAPKTPAPTTFIWEVTDFFDFKQGEYYLNHYEKFYNRNQFPGISWDGEYLQYYIKARKVAQAQMNDDCLNMIGFWTIEVTTPKIRKGKYKLNSRIWDGIAFEVYIDGEASAIFSSSDKPAAGASPGTDDTGSLLYTIGEVDWPTTTEHKIKLVATNSNYLFWDRIEFVPVK